MHDYPEILIVDDEPGSRMALNGLLTGQGYHLESAEDGEEALARLARKAFDLILLDVMMPDMDGFEVCRKIREDDRLQEMPIILVTALDDRESKLTGLEAGADDFLSKPLDSAELRVRVRTVTRLNRYRRLLTEKAKFEWVVDHSVEGHLLLDSDDCIRYANKAAERILQSSDPSGTLLGQPFLKRARNFFLLQPSDNWETWLMDTPESASLPRFLIRPQTAAQSAREWRVDTFPFDAKEPERRIVRLTEVTDAFRMQNQISAFHQFIAHKLRTPANGFLGSLSLLEQRLASPDVATRSKFLRMALESGERLSETIEGVLNYLECPVFAETTQGCPVLDIPPLLERLAQELGLRIPVKVSDSLNGVRISLSPSAVERVFWELLSNSKKFHAQQTPSVSVTIDAVSTGIRFCVTDNSTHIPEDRIAQVWAPYSQVEDQSSGEVVGMGLGLPSVAVIIWTVGGCCQLRNNSNGPGIQVQFDIPKQEVILPD